MRSLFKLLKKDSATELSSQRKRLNLISCGGSNWLVQFSFLIFEAWVWGGSGSPSGAQRTGFWCFGTLLFFGVIASLKLIFLQSVFVREFVLCLMS